MDLYNKWRYETSLGRLDEAERSLKRLESVSWWSWENAAVSLAAARGDWARAESLCAKPPPSLAGKPIMNQLAARVHLTLLARRGEVRAAREGFAQATAQFERTMVSTTEGWAMRGLYLAFISSTVVPGPDSTMARSTRTAAVVMRGWRDALAGDVRGARRELADLRGRSADEQSRSDGAGSFLEASIAAAEGRWNDVLRLQAAAALQADPNGLAGYGKLGVTPSRWLVARAYEHVGLPDSAAAVYERMLQQPGSRDITFYVPYAHQRLVMICARMRRRADAERHWLAFSSMFVNPDPEARHLLDEARDAIKGMQ
jgi:hypothetical protein